MMTVREAYAIFFLETCKRAEEMDILKVREALDAIIPYDPDADRRTICVAPCRFFYMEPNRGSGRQNFGAFR